MDDDITRMSRGDGQELSSQIFHTNFGANKDLDAGPSSYLIDIALFKLELIFRSKLTEELEKIIISSIYFLLIYFKNEKQTIERII